MKRELRNGFLFFISFSVAFLFGLMLMNDNKKVVTDDDVNKSLRDNYNVYQVDQMIELKDNSLWYVVKQDDSRNRDITLISYDKINDNSVSNVDNYLENNYIDQLCKSLTINRNTVYVRLLNSYDIMDLYGKDGFDINNFDRSKFKLLENNTIVNETENGYYKSLCDNNLCMSKNTDIRVVIEIPKYFIKEN